MYQVNNYIHFICKKHFPRPYLARGDPTYPQSRGTVRTIDFIPMTLSPHPHSITVVFTGSSPQISIPYYKVQHNPLPNTHTQIHITKAHSPPYTPLPRALAWSVWMASLQRAQRWLRWISSDSSDTAKEKRTLMKNASHQGAERKPSNDSLEPSDNVFKKTTKLVYGKNEECGGS